MVHFDLKSKINFRTLQKGLIIRKLIHLSTGLMIWMLSYVVEKNVLLYLIIAGTVFSFLTFNHKKFHLLHKTADNSLGTLFYPAGIILSYLILYNLPLSFFRASLMILSISDTLANFAGQILRGNSWIRVLDDKKSLYGIIAYALSAYLLLYLFLPVNLIVNFPYLLLAVMLAVILEVASLRGSDNFSIPVGLALFFFLTFHYKVDYLYLCAILIVLVSGCFLLYRFNILTRRGSFIACLMGFYLAGITGWQWLVTVLIFFLSSAAFTKLHSILLQKGEKVSGRNGWQVMANSVWAVISSVFYLWTRNEAFILFFIAFTAAVTSDTWASEIGPLINRRCFSLASMSMEPAGISGGISVSGSLAALAGAVGISSVSYFIFFGHWHWYIIAILSVSAFMACFTDSLLGAYVESKILRMNYFKKQRKSESITPNDLVNMGGSFTAFIFYLLLSWIM